MSPQEALKRLRSETGLTQVELAEMLKVGFTTLNRWENGHAFPNRANASRIIGIAEDMGASRECVEYLGSVLLPSRIRGQSARELGFPEVDRELLCQVVDGSPTGMVISDEETKTIVYVNRKAEEIAGKPLVEARNKHCWSYMLHRDGRCAGCCPERYPENGCHEGFFDHPNGKRYSARTKSLRWKGKKVYLAYLVEVSGGSEAEAG